MITKQRPTLAIPERPKSWKQRVMEELVLRSWWVVLFSIFCYAMYLHGIHKKEDLVGQLSTSLEQLEKEKMLTLEQQEDLHLQLNSQSDPAWVQLMLMKGLGLVPEGGKKVYFHNDD